MSDFLLYGATGYVGRATAELAVERGLRPLLGGRSESVREVAGGLGLDAVVMSATDGHAIEAALADVPVVLNCAGPFVHTYGSFFDACLRTGSHYLDITGEPVVYEAAAALDADARRAGVMLLPGVGFDVVPTDCLAAHVAARLPTATQLAIAFSNEGPASLPPGTANTMLEMGASESSKLHRVDGQIVEAPERLRRQIDFGSGPVEAVLRTWGDIYLAPKSTGIRNVTNYLVLGRSGEQQIDVLERLRPLLRFGPVRRLIRSRIPTGASPERRAAASTHVWAEATDPDGGRAVSLLHGPEAGLEWTRSAALDVVARVLDGQAPPGHQTPSTAYGPDLVLETPGVVREDVTG